MKRALVPAFLTLAVAALVVPARAQVAGFADVPKDHWAASSIAKLVNAGIIASPAQNPQDKGKTSGAKAPAKPAYNGEKPVTRYELAVTLYRFVQYIDRADRQKKSKMGAQAAPANGAAAVQRLIAEGYLPKETPLALDGDKLVTANQLADALTHVVVRSREKASPVTPDSKYAPIQRPSAGPGH
jgi:hypothetical protein